MTPFLPFLSAVAELWFVRCRSRPVKTALLHLSLVAALAISVQSAEVRAASTSRPSPASISYVDSQLNEYGDRGFRFRVTNTSKAPLFFDGYSTTSPLYSVQFHRLGLFWCPIERGWCGTGAETRRLAPGASFSFWVDDPGTIWPWTAGIPFHRQRASRDGEFTVWSNTKRK